MRALILLLWAMHAFASQTLDPLDLLLKNVKEASITQSNTDRIRLETFISSSEAQHSLLAKAKADYEREQKKTRKLKARIDANEKELARLEEKLKLRAGNLGEAFGVVRQVGSDLRANIESSSTSAVLKNRVAFLDGMLSTKELPDINTLEKMWFLLQEEIIESGRVSTNQLEVIRSDGTKEEVDVTSIGLFNAFYDDRFLRYSPQAGAYIELPAQPGPRLRGIIEEFGRSSGVHEVVIDPTRGAILEMFSQKPTVMQRIEQGGVVGYIILSLGLVGIIISIIRFFTLLHVHNGVRAQLKNLETPNENNPLGRVMMLFERYRDIDMESFEAKIEEGILKELPKLKRFESLLKLIATVAPLLGLLGTVTGMIETFGAITLFGTSDPKLMAGGISQALMTTVLGLSVAIPMLFLYTFISSRSNKIVAILDEQSAGLIVKKMEHGRNH